MNYTIVTEFYERYRKNKEEYTLESMTKFEDVLKLFWDENPSVNVITWKQGTHFMSNFSISSILYSNAIEDSDTKKLFLGSYDNPKLPRNIWIISCHEHVRFFDQTYQIIQNKAKEISGVDSESIVILTDLIHSTAMYDVFMEFFGDPVQVIITRNDIKTLDIYDEYCLN